MKSMMRTNQQTSDYALSYCRDGIGSTSAASAIGAEYSRHQQRNLFQLISRNSMPFQIVKYVLLILNIMIVATTAIVTIIVCLLPTIIYEKKLALDNASAFLKTGNLQQQQQLNYDRRSLDEHELIQLSAQEIDTIRLVRYFILALSSLIILNQTLAVYGLFKERSFNILISTVVIGLIGQLSLFVLPASIFILITIYLIFSISYVIILNHLNLMVREPQIRQQVTSRAPSIEPSQRTCCCRCKSCQCMNVMTNQSVGSAIIDNVLVNRKASIHTNHLPQPSSSSYPNNQVPYYYGSLGRGKSRNAELRPGSINQSTSVANSENIYAQRPPIHHHSHSRSPGLRPTNKCSNMNLVDTISGGFQSRKEMTPTPTTTNYFAFEMSKDTDII
ncbi:uncharacterized protein LOC124492094 [Dermatophagoides farinae]|nr:uncharacterized protein LOC124492094 [Dermatophagoides farinae]